MIVFLIALACVVFMCILVRVKDQKEGSKSEKVGKAIGGVAQSVANTVSDVAFQITESSENRTYRLAREIVVERNSKIFDFVDSYLARTNLGDSLYLEQLFMIDDNLKNALDTLNVSEQIWKQVAEKLFHIGVIRKMAYWDRRFYKQKCDKIRRKEIVYDDYNLPNGNFLEKEDSDYLRGALNYFNIPYQEWIEYGDIVIDMHNLEDDINLKKYGYRFRYYDPESKKYF